MASSRNLVLTIGAQASLKKGGRNQVSGRISVPCWHVTPVANAPWKPLINPVKVKLGIMVIKLVERLIGWEVTVGHGSECHLTFVRGRLHIAEWDPRIDHKLPEWRDDFKRSTMYPCLGSLLESRLSRRMKHSGLKLSVKIFTCKLQDYFSIQRDFYVIT